MPLIGGGHSILSPKATTRNFRENKCKSGQASDGKIWRTGRRSKLFLVLIRGEPDLNQSLDSLSETVTDCPDLFRPGLYHPANSIVFFLLVNRTAEAQKLTDLVFNVHYVQSHPKVVAFYHAHENSNPFLVRYNAYQNQQKVTVVQDQEILLKGVTNDFPMQVCVQHC